VTREAYNILKKRLLEGIRSAGRVDGVLLRLHGAMTVEDLDDAEGDILTSVREIVGSGMPIVSTLDQHALVTKAMVEHADILVGYDTNPHMDYYERGHEAADLLFRLMKQRIKPVMVMEKPRILPTTQRMITIDPSPMSTLMEIAHRFETQQGVLCVSVFGGYPYTDAPDGGMTMLATTDGDKDLARRIVRELSQRTWEMRDQWLYHPTPLNEAVEKALSAPAGPVILADIADNGAAGGAAGDGTVLLKELMKAGAQSTALCSIADPEAVARCMEAGVGNTAELLVGGKRDRLHGDPVSLKGLVRLIHHGNFTREGPMKPGTLQRVGRTAVVEVGGYNGIELMLTEFRTHPTDQAFFKAFGIDPTRRRILVVKAGSMYRGAFRPIASAMIDVDTPGITSPNLTTFYFKKLRRPIFPLDDIRDLTDE